MTQDAAQKQLLANLHQCIQRVAESRDKLAFAELFDHYAPLIKSYSLAREPAAELVADDLVQEVMIRLWTRAERFNPQRSNLNTWLFTIARNCRIDSLRRNGRIASEIDPTSLFEKIEDESPGPWQRVNLARVSESIKTGLKRLPRDQSDTLVRVFLEGKTHQQVSDDLKLPLGTVKTRVRQGLKKLQLSVKR